MFDDLGLDWLIDEVEKFTDHIDLMSPTEFSEAFRYLKSESPVPGPMSFDFNPYMREIVDCADVRSPIREVNIKKGVKVTYSTCLDSVMFYFAAHIRTTQAMYISADKELAVSRLQTKVIPMLQQSGFGDIMQSIDESSSRKTGKTKERLEFIGGGSLMPFGAINANKMRDWSVEVALKDELDAWKQIVGVDGHPDKLTDARCNSYWHTRKIFRGGTPTITDPTESIMSRMDWQYKRGDQRKYFVNCIHCGFSQFLIWQMENDPEDVNNGWPEHYGMTWDMKGKKLDKKSVRYICKKCGGAHKEHDKETLFSPDHGAKWIPTAEPVDPTIRSYHLPGLYAPVNTKAWADMVVDWLDAWNVETGKIRDHIAMREFYNNTMGEPWKIIGGEKIPLESVSAHRRAYAYGEVPNTYAEKHSGSKILFLTCQVDVHDKFLSVTVMGWTRDARCYVIDYYKIKAESEFDKCTEEGSSVWATLREVIDDKVYTADDGHTYRIMTTLIDSNGRANSAVVMFCSEWEVGVIPILGRGEADKQTSIKEFQPFKTQAQTQGYKILVDYYKNRLAPVLKREWIEGATVQDRYHFNVPYNMRKDQLEELTAETLLKKTDTRSGQVSYYWHRPSGRRNELWDLLVYGHAAVDIIAYNTCIQVFELETIDWAQFWDFMENNLLES